MSQVVSYKSQPNSVICFVTCEAMTDPVVDQHGHGFERAAILQSLKDKLVCPMNGKPLALEDLRVNRSVKERIESYQAQRFQTVPLEVDLKQPVLELAQQALYNKDTINAMRLCRQVLDAFPGYGEAWKIMAAMQQDASEKIKTLLKGANESTMSIKERIELCRMVLIKVPEHSEAKLLFLELTCMKMSNKIKELKHGIPSAFFSISKAEWSAPHSIKNLPAYPIKLQEFLSGACSVWEGRTAAETHIVVPLFKYIAIDVNGSTVLALRTLKTLGKLDKSSGGPGYDYVWSMVFKNRQIRTAEEFHYGVLTKDVLPGTRNEPYSSQKQLVESKGYVVPPALDAATALLWENRCTGNRWLNDDPKTFTVCQEKIENVHLVVGNFASKGLSVGSRFSNSQQFGMAGFKIFII